MNLKIDNNKILILVSLLIFFASFLLWGFIGFKTVFGLLFVFFLPIYLIIDNFDFEFSEKIIFSFFIGLGIVSALIYWLGRLISFKISIFLAAVVFILIGISLRYFKPSFLVKK